MNDTIIPSNMLPVGTILHGTYRIDGYLASGGFGNTYVVTNIQFGERYAIKEFFMKGVTERDENTTTISVSNLENAGAFEAQKAKFKKEAIRLRKLSSPHIIRVHDLFEENGTAYYVMDFVDGENLRDQLKRLGHPLDETAVWKIFEQVLDALEVVHGQGLFHLDLKPANLMVDKKGEVKLIDFGASKQMSAESGATTSTAVSYTNGYAPREQMEQALEKFGPWTDFYALGATLYFLLTNKKPPIPSDIDDDMTEDKQEALAMPKGVSSRMRRLILWLMETDRRKRPQTVAEIRKMMSPEEKENPKGAMDREEKEDVTAILEKPSEKKDCPGSAHTEEENTSATEPITEDSDAHVAKKSVWKWGLIVLAFAIIGFFGAKFFMDKDKPASSLGGAVASDSTLVDTTKSDSTKVEKKQTSAVKGGKSTAKPLGKGGGKAADESRPATKKKAKHEQATPKRTTQRSYYHPTYEQEPAARPSKQPTSGGSSGGDGYRETPKGGKTPSYGTSSSKQNSAGSSDW